MSPSIGSSVGPDAALEGAPARRVRRAFNSGQESAANGGVLSSRPSDVKTLREQEEQSAGLDSTRGPYDPKSNPDDAVREKRYQELCAERADLIEQREYAFAHLRDRRLAAACSPPVPAAPNISHLFVAMAVAVFALTLVPTLHDFLFVTLPARWAWASSALCAGTIGLFLELGDRRSSSQLVQVRSAFRTRRCHRADPWPHNVATFFGRDARRIHLHIRPYTSGSRCSPLS